MTKTKVNIAGASVDFYSYEIEGITYYEFDTSHCEPPEPMVNAMHGLKLLKDKKTKLVMINMQEPMGLYPRIEDEVKWFSSLNDDGNVRIIFSLK